MRKTLKWTFKCRFPAPSFQNWGPGPPFLTLCIRPWKESNLAWILIRFFNINELNCVNNIYQNLQVQNFSNVKMFDVWPRGQRETLLRRVIEDKRPKIIKTVAAVFHLQTKFGCSAFFAVWIQYLAHPVLYFRPKVVNYHDCWPVTQWGLSQSLRHNCAILSTPVNCFGIKL